jgi:hypothetical protein
MNINPAKVRKNPESAKSAVPRPAICHLLPSKRPPFSVQKATFCNAKDGLLQGVECQDVTQAKAGRVQFHGFPLLQGLRISLLLPQ